MRFNLFIIMIFILVQQSFAQTFDSQNVSRIDVKEYDELTTVISHTMGDVNVQGYNGETILAYSQEMLPSLTELKLSTTNKVFENLAKADFSEREIQLKKSPEFHIKIEDGIVFLNSNIYSFNSNVHILTPYRSNVIVRIKDMGDVLIRDINNSVEVETKAGNIMIANAKGTINASTQNGNVVTKFRHNRKKPLFLSTFVGNIEVIVPKTTNNSVLASSEMGSLYSNFSTQNGLSANAKNKNVKNRKINFNINKGGAEFVIYTFKGDIYLRYLE